VAHDDFQELALAGERLQARQRDREKAQRDAATGRRARSILRGDLGPVLKRWVSGSVVPVAARLRDLSEAIQRGDLDGASTLAASPMFGLPDLTGSPDLRVIIDWGLASEDRLPDLVLTVMGVAISACASNRDGPIPLTRLLTACAHASREAAIGTFLTEVQGAKAMLRVRKSGKAAWAQRKKMDAVAAMMAGQVRSALGEDPVVPVRGKEVVSIISQSGDARRIDLRRPAPEDWKLLD
jgi:hypothetical protein